MHSPVPAKVSIGMRSPVAPLLRQLRLDLQALDGASGAPAPEEMAVAVQAFRRHLQATRAEDEARIRKELTRGLPAGVQLETTGFDVFEDLVVTNTTFALDDLRKLPLLRMSFEPGSARSRPFAELVVSEDERGLQVLGMPPALSLEGGEGSSEPLSALELRFELEVERPVLECSASEVGRGKAGVLSWRFDGARLSARTPDDAGWIHVCHARSVG